MSNSPQRPAGDNPRRPADESPRTGWNGAGRELAVAGLLAVVLTAAAWALDGPAAAGFVLLICIAVSLVVLRALIEPDQEPPAPETPSELGPGLSFIGVWRTRSDLVDAINSLARVGVPTPPQAHQPAGGQAVRAAQDQPGRRSAGGRRPAPRDQARRYRARRTGRDGTRRDGTTHDLWRWLDPSRPAPPDAESLPGIPPNVLAALIDRLEKL